MQRPHVGVGRWVCDCVEGWWWWLGEGTKKSYIKETQIPPTYSFDFPSVFERQDTYLHTHTRAPILET